MLLDEIVDHLAAGGLGTIDKDILWGPLPEEPHEAIWVNETPGSPPASAKGQAVVYERPRFQVIVRSLGYRRGRDRAERVHRHLHGFGGHIKGVHYASISAVGSVYAMPFNTDNRNRPMIACNYEATKEPSPLADE